MRGVLIVNIPVYDSEIYFTSISINNLAHFECKRLVCIKTLTRYTLTFLVIVLVSTVNFFAAGDTDYRMSVRRRSSHAKG